MATPANNKILNRQLVSRKTKFTNVSSNPNYLLNVNDINTEFSGYSYVSKSGTTVIPNNSQVWPKRTFKYSSVSAASAYSSLTTKTVYIENQNWDSNYVNILETNNSTYFYSSVSKIASSSGYYMDSDSANTYYYINSSGLITQKGTYTPTPVHSYVFTFDDGTVSKTLPNESYLYHLANVALISKQDGSLYMISSSDISIRGNNVSVNRIYSLNGYVYVEFAIEENTSTISRLADITITQPNSGFQCVMTITQQGKQQEDIYAISRYSPVSSTVNVTADTTSYTLIVTSTKNDSAFTISSSNVSVGSSATITGISYTVSRVSTTAQYQINLSFNANTTATERIAIITVTQPTSGKYVYWTINQSAAGGEYSFTKIRPTTTMLSLSNTGSDFVTVASKIGSTPVDISTSDIAITHGTNPISGLRLVSVDSMGVNYTINFTYIVPISSTLLRTATMVITQPGSGKTLSYSLRLSNLEPIT